MSTITTVLIIMIALLHLYFLVLEMFLWNTPKGIKTFSLSSKEYADSTKVLAANQGLYNGFLAAGLLWSLFIKNHEWSLNISLFFLLCVSVAGIYGSISTKKSKIFYIQALPAIITIILTLI